MCRVICLFLALFIQTAFPAHSASAAPGFGERCAAQALPATPGGRVVCADIAAIEQTLVYNRFGSFDPFGMIFALRRDLVPQDSAAGQPARDMPDCRGDLGAATDDPGPLTAGQVRLRDCERPRPLVLRANVGDHLLIRVSNYLRAPVPDLGADFCPDGTDDTGRAAVHGGVSTGDALAVQHGEATCDPSATARAALPDWPRTRGVNFTVQGLRPLPLDGARPADACLGFSAVPPGGEFWCLYEITVEGTHFAASTAAPAGGQGDGGSIVHGLFAAILAERPGTRWYRSQVSETAFDDFWPRASGAGAARHARAAKTRPDYEAMRAGIPVLNMARAADGAAGFRDARRLELVHADLNAIVMCDALSGMATNLTIGGCAVGHSPNLPAAASPTEPKFSVFREFSVFFHDELKTFYTRNFDELGRLGQLAGVRDGFAINYGASGMGAMLLANRKGIGPAASCVECLYEEFFLTSWANGDPALLEWFVDDPSNVHHSYLNDPVVFRNFHAGPKETHVFHLHAHQWFAGNDPARGSYLDSQTVAPQQGFTYNIYSGGLNGGTGGWQAGGSGNRNHTPGDSIFHCHLYPHFAQGMWALWRVHDVLEDGTRRLPDGQARPGLSLSLRRAGDVKMRRPGSVGPAGEWLDARTGGPLDQGTPVPALVPLPGEPLPLLPTYTPAPASPATEAALDSAGPERLILAGGPAAAQPPAATAAPVTAAEPRTPVVTAMPGYPFYIAGRPGHRPPQAPMDIARDAAGKLMSGGIGRHVIADGTRVGAEDPLPDNASPADERARERTLGQQIARAFALGDLTAHLKDATIETLDPNGTGMERAAMGFHASGLETNTLQPLALLDATGAPVPPALTGGYASTIAPIPGDAPLPAAPGRVEVNGAPPAPGAPFADPCGGAEGRRGAVAATDQLTGLAFARDPRLTGFRRYEVSAVQLDLIVNRAGWHDPQARIDVLTARSDDYKVDKGDKGNKRISPVISDNDEPFFFRALSGECIEFRHTNELPKELALDDFQVRTPTDTIGQHIHLVKFDVMASDGSGNGWNYEDGTFAPDELMARRCAAGDKLTEMPEWGTTKPADPADCKPYDAEPHKPHHNWRLKRSEHPDLFQTTTQRWFADPILTRTERGSVVDRTLRTVFSHDHFGPSSIQQHGFYAALLIEPSLDGDSPTRICKHPPDCVSYKADLTRVATGDENLVGATRKVRLKGPDDPLHPDYQEFALAIADFALLYDPRDRQTLAEATGPQSKGMARLLCEAEHRGSPQAMAENCGTSELARDKAGNWFAHPLAPPAWLAGGQAGDGAHKAGLADLIDKEDITKLGNHLASYRARAAGMDAAAADKTRVLASPVAAPLRPESISVDHHDPYLVNYRNAPIPLRIGTSKADGTAAPDCAPLDMRAPGSGLDGTSGVIDALANGRFGQCSYAYQLAGAAGDLGSALSSWGSWGEGPGPKAGRDPETPILTAEQGDRIMIRMVQGAQEVQHNFTIAGMPVRRNIDQAFPQAMIDRAQTEPGPRDACFEALRHSRPAEYEAWLSEGGKPGGTGFDAMKWDDIARALAECDNIEGHTYAQEIGISEHFEIRARLRADNIQTERAPDAPPPPAMSEALDGPDTGTRGMSDYLYHFGSLDALWNGAWGLIRVTEPDTGRGDESAGEGGVLPPVENVGIGCPLPRADRPARHTMGIAVAVRTGEVWPDRGTDYDTLGQRGLNDPDGLMLALLPADRLDGDRRSFIADPGWDAIPRGDVLAAIRATYERPEPFVLRANAGDCVILRFINMLPGDDATGLPDLLGDARMPAITPLNTDPAAAVTVADGRTTAAHLLRGGGLVRPSARLGLSIGLPGGELIRDLPLGFGVNRIGLPGQAGATVAATPMFDFYAGRMRVIPTGRNEMVKQITDALEARLGDDQAFRGALADANPRAREAQLERVTDAGPNRVEILGASYAVTLWSDDAPLRTLTESDALLGLVRQLSRDVMDRNVHWIPYAFGPVPVRATGDVITQTPHGLFGIIDVLPRSWPIEGAPAAYTDTQPDHVTRRSAPPVRGFGAPMRFTLPQGLAPDGLSGPARVREFVLFYQDGLNLRDRGSKLAWTWHDDGKPVERGAVVQRWGPMVPDCLICDDSYDLGEAGVSYRSAAFAPRLRSKTETVEASDDFNRIEFPSDFLARAPLTLTACPGETVVIRAIHPGGRARQRAFVMNSYGYDDLFPGFGFPNAALLGPGKSVSAWLTQPFDADVKGLWHDGPLTLTARGTWGVLAAGGADECGG